MTADLVRAEMGRARTGLTAQLESFTHNSTEFLRREQDLLLHGHGVPRTATDMAGRPVVVAVRSHGWEDELRGIKPFIREQRPVLVGVDRGADALVEAGHRPDVVVVTAGDDLPSAAVLRKARDVVVLVERGAHAAPPSSSNGSASGRCASRPPPPPRTPRCCWPRRARPRSSSASACTPRSSEFLDRRRAGLASTFLTRLKLGPDLVDADRRAAALRRRRTTAPPAGCARGRSGRGRGRGQRHAGRPAVGRRRCHRPSPAPRPT